MAKKTSNYVCSECGHTESKWLGKCPTCQEWNTFEEKDIVIENKKIRTSNSISNIEVRRIGEISADEGERIPTGISECDRVLGGGIVKGSLILLSGDPGIGKSTLLLQMTNNLAERGEVLYASGEESASQLKIRAERLGISSNNILIVGERDILSIVDKINEIKPLFVIIDSIQTMVDGNMNSAEGSVSQIKQCTSYLMQTAKTLNIPIVIVGHVTKEGNISGPKHLEHMVDTVLFFEGDMQQQVRILRTTKNRFGSTNEVGIFEMCNEGLREVTNPSELFLSEDIETRSGACVFPTMEGTRPILVEIQALVVPTLFNNPRRMASGIDYNRLILISAVLERKIGLSLNNYDVYVNVVGGIKIPENSVDLAMACAIYSAMKDIPIPASTVVIGEIGLTGELRNVPHLHQRMIECNRLGWKNAFVPNQPIETPNNFNIKKSKTVKDVLTNLFRV